jgi:multiple sugar transport system substrate-binding protein
MKLITRAAFAATVFLSTTATQAGTVSYFLWDPNQQPVYEQCAKAFELLNPNIKINITRSDWETYWKTLDAGMAQGNAPDVFVNHLANTAKFMRDKRLVDLQPLIDQDLVPTKNYVPQLLSNWKREGKQYGLPKDWDTIAMAVNLDLAKAAGIGKLELEHMNWNPVDGGSFERIISKLTQDTQGKTPDMPGFNPKSVAVYGYATTQSGGMTGQTSWNHFAVSAGFKFQNQPWDNTLKYDNPHLAATLTWLESLSTKGIAPRLVPGAKMANANDQFIEGKLAMLAQGSWDIMNTKNKIKSFAFTWVPLPVGPIGQHATMFNGLADSISSSSKNKQEAWKWVKFMGSPACQTMVAKSGVVFPSLTALFRKTLYSHAEQGLRTDAFLSMALGKVFPPPTTEYGVEINEIMTQAIDSILSGQAPAGPTLKAADVKIRAVVAQKH